MLLVVRCNRLFTRRAQNPSSEANQPVTFFSFKCQEKCGNSIRKALVRSCSAKLSMDFFLRFSKNGSHSTQNTLSASSFSQEWNTILALHRNWLQVLMTVLTIRGSSQRVAKSPTKTFIGWLSVKWPAGHGQLSCTS